jgi:hypothetical protein
LFSANADDESSHAAKIATMQSATKIFFIKILRPTATFIQWKYNYSLIHYATVFSSSLPIRRSSSSMSFFLAEEGFFVPFTYAANRG